MNANFTLKFVEFRQGISICKFVVSFMYAIDTIAETGSQEYTNRLATRTSVKHECYLELSKTISRSATNMSPQLDDSGISDLLHLSLLFGDTRYVAFG